MGTPVLGIGIEEAERLALEFYGLKVQAKKLAGEEDQNFYLESNEGAQYTLKISRPNINEEEIDFQIAILNYLSEKKFPLRIPSPNKAHKKEDYLKISDNRILRLQTWVPGRMLASVNPRTSDLFKSWGKTCGLFSRYLSDFDHPGGHWFYKWNPSESLYSKKYRSYFQSDEQKQLAGYFWGLFEEKALPLLPALRKSINYSDAHEHNLLVNNDLIHPQISGVIDFGDALYSETINELAIACAYAGMNMPDPLEAMAKVVEGYHPEFNIEEQELEVLFPLIAARLMITVASAAWNKHNEPENEYLLISEKPAWDLLKKLRPISPTFAQYTFRAACGYEPCPLNIPFKKWIEANADVLISPVSFQNKKVANMNLSVGSLDLGNNSNFENIKNYKRRIKFILDRQDADFGIGGYGECRPFYTGDAYRIIGNQGAQWRTVHLGIDVWTEAGTEVVAPLDGIVESFQNNSGEGNYGPTIVLRHEVSEELIFYTLYGHLSIDSLQNLKIGNNVKQGETFAKIGSPPSNGNWPAHLHFQLMLDLFGNEGDFPGVAFPYESKSWMSSCPDPQFFFPNQIEKFQTASNDEIIALRKKHLGKSLSISYQRPLHIVRGYKQYLYDEQGRRYLDVVNNVAHVGHQHSRIVHCLQRQAELLNTNSRYLHENILRIREELLKTFPPELSVVYFVNSGSEANELALRMAKSFSGVKDFIAVESGYHGNTNACIEISSYKFDGKGGKGAPPHTHVVPMPDTFRGLNKDKKQAGEMYAHHVQSAIEKIQTDGRTVAGFICESILSCGGQIVLPTGYLKSAYTSVRKAGGLCIADEVQVGFGRVGKKFWGFELQDVVPDIVTLGKPIGNGHPLAAVVTTKIVAEAFANGMEYFNTFGGNPVSCAVGQEVLNIVEEEGLQAHAREVGAYLIKGLRGLQNRFPIIGEVRGVGLFLGIELVKDRDSLEPASAEASYLVNRMRDRGILLSTDGPLHNVIKIKPPMCFDKNNADFFLDNLELVLGEDFMNGW